MLEFLSLLNGEIIVSIAEKSTDFKQFVNKGTLELCATKTRGNYKHAVIKMSSKICFLISKRNGQIYVGLNTARLIIGFGWHSVITVKNFTICPQSVTERKNHQPVRLLLLDQT